MDRSSFSRREYITQALRGLGIAFASGASPASAPEDTNSRVLLEYGRLTACPRLARAATSALRSGYTLRNPRRTSCAASALHTKRQTDAPRGQRLPPRRSLPDWRVRKRPTARSSRPRSPRTSDYARSGRSPRPLIVEVERKAQGFRVPSTQSPKCSAEQLRIPAPMESPPAIASAPSPPFLRGNRAIPAGARTIGRRTPRPLPAQPLRSSIFPGARVLRAPSLEHRWSVHESS